MAAEGTCFYFATRGDDRTRSDASEVLTATCGFLLAWDAATLPLGIALDGMFFHSRTETRFAAPPVQLQLGTETVTLHPADLGPNPSVFDARRAIESAKTYGPEYLCRAFLGKPTAVAVTVTGRGRVEESESAQLRMDVERAVADVIPGAVPGGPEIAILLFAGELDAHIPPAGTWDLTLRARVTSSGAVIASVRSGEYRSMEELRTALRDVVARMSSDCPR
jgi:hypothetical protein